MNFDALIDDLIAVADRRDHLCRHVPVCPSCGTDQVQLVGQDVPAAWRCRRCRFRFSHEPPPL